MRSGKLGQHTSAEVSNVSITGFWLLIADKERFLPFEDIATGVLIAALGLVLAASPVGVLGGLGVLGDLSSCLTLGVVTFPAFVGAGVVGGDTSPDDISSAADTFPLPLSRVSRGSPIA